MGTVVNLLDDSTRPEPPDLGVLSESEHLAAKELKIIHDHHRENMKALRQMIEAANAGEISVEQVEELKDNLSYIRNMRKFGSLCGQHCHIMHGHHAIEDGYFFPELSTKARAFQNVINRLLAEHDALLVMLNQLLDEVNVLVLSPSPEAFRKVVASYDRLETALLSHFTYEERTIGPALARYRIGA